MYLGFKNKDVKLIGEIFPQHITESIHTYRDTTESIQTESESVYGMLLNRFSMKLNRFSMKWMNRFITKTNRFNHTNSTFDGRHRECAFPYISPNWKFKNSW